MNKAHPFGEEKIKHLQLFIYLIPVVGTLPALWTLFRREGSREQQKTSRLSVTLALIWLLAYSLLWMGAMQSSGFLTLRLLFMNSLFTTGYFLICISLMVRLWQGKLPRLPIISHLAEGVGRKYLS